MPANSGTSVLDLMAAYEELVGPEVVARSRAKLPEEARSALEAVTPLSWLPVSILGKFVDQLGLETGQDADALLDRAVVRATERTFKTVWRVLLRFTSDEALLSRTPTFYSKSRNKGRLEARKIAPGKAELTLLGWPGVSARHVRTVAVGIAKVVELAGRREVEVDWNRTREGACYRLTWSP